MLTQNTTANFHWTLSKILTAGEEKRRDLIAIGSSQKEVLLQLFTADAAVVLQ